MTNFALVIWSYQEKGSALTTALLSVCSYAPYVLMSIFAGAFSDRWNKKSSCWQAILLQQDVQWQCWYCCRPAIWKSGIYTFWNALNGLMNTFQQPAADVTVSLLTPKKHYQKVSGMRTFSSSLTSILTPVIATGLLAFTNIQTVIAVDLTTFGLAFRYTAVWNKGSGYETCGRGKKKVLQAAKSGLRYLKHNRGILDLILFLAAINLTASMYNAALPAMLLSVDGGR